MNARHERRILGQSLGQRQGSGGILLRHILQIDLIEHAAPPVLGQCREIVLLKLFALREEAVQVGFRRNVVGRIARQAAPKVGDGCVGGVGDEPLQQPLHIGQRSRGREKRRGLQVGGIAEVGKRDAALGKPRRDGLTEVQRFGHVEPASESIGVAIRAQHEVGRTDRLNVNANAIGHRELPIILGYARENMMLPVLPRFGDKGVFNPYETVARCGTLGDDGVLREHRGLLLDALLNDIPLVLDQILNFERGRKQFGRGAEMVELAAGQGQHGYFQLCQFGVVERGVKAERTAEIGVKVIVVDALHALLRQQSVGRLAALAHQEMHGAVGKQPHADVHHGIVRLHEPRLLFGRRLLQHEVEHIGVLAAHHEHAMMRSLLHVGPETVAHNVGIGYVLQRLGGTQIHVAAGNERAQRGRRFLQDALVKRHLKIEQSLVYFLSPRPTKYRNGREYLAARGIRRQAAALAAGMEQHALFFGEPFLERGFGGIVAPGRFKQPRRTAAGAEFVTHGVGSAEIFVMGKARNVVETIDDVGRKGK